MTPAMLGTLIAVLTAAIHEVGMTIRFVVSRNDRTANLIKLTIVFMIGWYYHR